jgi:hypothetical protein
MLQLDNQTPFAARITVLPDADAIDTLHVLVKATVNLSPRISLAKEQLPVTLADAYHGEPGRSSLREVSEMHIGKPGTDVIITGCARPPGGHPVREMLVTARVADRQRVIRVVGDRLWDRDGRAGAPEPFEAMPLVWERAYGGVDDAGREVTGEERNPVGVGFLGDRSPGDLAGTRAPNLLDPQQPCERLGDVSDPSCFAPVAAAWLPRRHYAGTYDAAWQRQRAPYLPKDFDARFLQCAAGGFAFEHFFSGGEPISISGMAAEADVAFEVPTVAPRVLVRIAKRTETPDAHLETLWIEPEFNRAQITWRATVSCDRHVLHVERIAIDLDRAART